MYKKNILFIDTWLRGLEFIIPIQENLNQYNLSFLHYSSYFGPGAPDNCSSLFSGQIEDIKNISCLKKYLVDGHFDAIIFISAHGPLQREINELCDGIGIKTYLFLHGARFKKDLPSRVSMGGLHLLKRVYFYLNLFLKLRFKLSNSHMLGSLILWIEFFLFKNQFDSRPKSKIGKKYQSVFLNHNADVAYFKVFFGKPFKYFITGNVRVMNDCISALKYEIKNSSIVIFSQPGITDHLSRTTFSDDVNLLTNKYELPIIVRPHPTEDAEICKKKFEALLSTKIEIDFHNTAAAVLAKGAIFIGANSMALSAAKVLHKPSLRYVSETMACNPYLDGFLDFDSIEDAVQYFSMSIPNCDIDLRHPGQAIAEVLAESL